MHTKPLIRRIISAWLLCIFIFSITPKQWLHDIVTNHKDSYVHSVNGEVILSKSGFHCNCDNLVVQSPFINYDGPAELNIPELFVLHQTAIINNLISSYHFFSELRGPPVLS